MFDLLFAVFAQSLTFIPLAIGISISYHILRATDMTIDGSFVLGAGVFARLITEHYSPPVAALLAIASGGCAGMLTAFIQRKGRIDALLAGVLATFVLASLNLVIMGRPNIGLLGKPTLVDFAFAKSDYFGYGIVAIYTLLLAGLIYCLLYSRLGLILRAFGDNPQLLKRLGKNIEIYRMLGFSLTNVLAAASGCLTAQTIGYADVGMGFGMTLTGIGTIILGQQILTRVIKHKLFRTGLEFFACFIGVILYYFTFNLLLYLDMDPIYLKMLLGMILIIFLRAAVKPKQHAGALSQ
jgi:putative tryptophan/tyrosine transport system permease protein